MSPSAGQALHGIDRMVRNVESGRFERSPSALTAAGALSPPHLVTCWRLARASGVSPPG